MGVSWRQEVTALESTRVIRNPALDGIRLLAICLVMLHHGTSGDGGVLMHLLGIQKNNGFGHVLFLVLSGALITTVIRQNHNIENRYSNFLTRRFLRIFPLYFGYLLIALLATWLLTRSIPVNLWVSALFVQNFFHRIAQDTHSVLETDHLWTIAVQDQFYLIWPLLLWRCKNIDQMRILCCIGIAVSLIVRAVGPGLNLGFNQETIGHTLPAAAGCICLGGLLSLEWTNPTWFTAFLRHSFFPLLIATLIWMWFGMDYNTRVGSVLGYHLVALVCAGLIMVASNPASTISAIFATPFLAFCGRNLAYGLYMFHPTILVYFLHHTPGHSRILRLLVFPFVTALLAWLSYRYFESPFLRMKPSQRRRSTKLETTTINPGNASLDYPPNL